MLWCHLWSWFEAHRIYNPPSSIYPPISAPDSPAHNLCDISQKKGVVQNIHFFNFLGRFGSFGLKHTYWLQRCCKACEHLPGNTRASPSRHEHCEGLRVGPPGLESTPGCSLRMLGSLPNSISIHNVCATVPISAPLYCMFLGIRGFVVLFSASFLWKILNLQKRRKDFSECPCKYQFTLTLLPFWCLLSVFQLKIFTHKLYRFLSSLNTTRASPKVYPPYTRNNLILSNKHGCNFLIALNSQAIFRFPPSFSKYLLWLFFLPAQIKLRIIIILDYVSWVSANGEQLRVISLY